jgi:hypothetical protein
MFRSAHRPWQNTRSSNEQQEKLMGAILSRFSLSAALLLSLPPLATATSIYLDFDDGLLPSSHGWTYSGSVSESSAFSVSSGILTLNTSAPPGENTAWYQIGFDSTQNLTWELRARVVSGHLLQLVARDAQVMLDTGGSRPQIVFYRDIPSHEYVTVSPNNSDEFHTFLLTYLANSSTYRFYRDPTW